MVSALAIGLSLFPAQNVPSRMLWVENPPLSAEGIWEKELDPEIGWNELVISWNAELSKGASLKVSARPISGTQSYVLGIWTNDKTTRKSINKQETPEVKVSTDTLISKAPLGKVVITCEVTGGTGDLRLVTANFAVKPRAAIPYAENRAVWGKVLEPPRRAQMSYPGGKVYCSPTAVSMILGYWAEKLDRPEIDRDVPLVVEGVFDPEWPGTGNWPFNTAFAGSVPGMRGYVARLWAIPQLEAWIERGIPVACSVSSGLLQGKGKQPDDGHLVVLVGFTPEGDPVFNDPGRNVVRMTYKRSDFEAAWAHSGRTCYLIYPRFWAPPENKDRCWID